MLLQPENLNTAWMLALSCLRVGKSDEAEATLRRLLRAEPDYLWGRLVRAALFTQQGKIEDALIDLNVAAEQGYDTYLLLNEPLFEPLWSDPRFDDILRGIVPDKD